MGTQGDFNCPSLPPGGARGDRGGRSRAIRRERNGHSAFLFLCFVKKWVAYRKNALLRGLDKRFRQSVSKHFWSSYYCTWPARQTPSSHVSNACEEEKRGSLFKYAAQGLGVRATKGNSG